ncbi:MAG: hypothetical protein ACOY5B_01305 [Spirochaetota bacterium]
MRHLFLVGCALLVSWSCRLGGPTSQNDFLLINLSMPRSATTSFAGIFGNYRSKHEYMISETIHHLLDFRENKIPKETLQRFLRERSKQSRLQVDSASFFFLAPDLVIDTFPEAYFFFTFRSCESWIVSMVDNSVFAHKMIRAGKHTVDISFLDRYSEYFISNHSHAVFQDMALLAAQADHIVANLARVWGDSTLRVLMALDRVAPEQRLVIRMSEFSKFTPRFAELAKIPPDTLITENLHLNRDRDTRLYVRLLGAERLARFCSPRQQKVESWIKEHRMNFPDVSQP